MYYIGHLSRVPKILAMPKRQDEDDELAAFRARDARWLHLADATLSASEKTIQALDLAREEQQSIRKQLKGNIEKYQRLERRRKAKKA